jgi:hypothetical protein
LVYYLTEERQKHIGGQTLFFNIKDVAIAILEHQGITGRRIGVERYQKKLETLYSKLFQWLSQRPFLKPSRVRQLYRLLFKVVKKRVALLCPRQGDCTACSLLESCLLDPFNRHFKAVYPDLSV